MAAPQRRRRSHRCSATTTASDHDGQEVFVIHTDASDPEVADMLEGMGSPVPAVPSLAAVPEHARTPLFALANGVRPADGPAGPWGSSPTYSPPPLATRNTRLPAACWSPGLTPPTPGCSPRAQDVQAVEAGGEVTLQRPDLVVNIQLLTWPGGER